jgi:peptidoglycan/LPS O-acetylase OafA/YrhL
LTLGLASGRQFTDYFRVLQMARVQLPALTGLRIVAAGMIVANHSRALHIPVPNYALDHGVSFFFVLSGFIIAYAYPKLDSKGAVFSFLAARIARIWPAHFVALLLVVALFQLPLDRTFVANALLLHAWVPSSLWYFSYNAPSWSISTECFFYIAFPVLIYRWDRSWWWKWTGSAILVAALIWIGDALRLPVISPQGGPCLEGLLYINPLARLFEFATGMVAHSAFQYLRPMSQKLSGGVFTLLEILVVIVTSYSIVTRASQVLLASYFQGTGMEWLWFASDVFLFPIVVVVFAFGRGRLSHFFGSPPMVVMGEISYSVYLVHITVFAFYLRGRETDISPDYLGLAVCVAATLVLAFIIWVVVEVPCRTAAKQWLKRRSVFLSSPTVSEEQA